MRYIPMGREKYIVLENKEYESVINILYKAFQAFDHGYTLRKDHNGFSLCAENAHWPEVMQIRVDVGNKMDNVVLDGETYIYCLFHIGGDKADPLLQILIKAMEHLNIPYSMEDL